MSDPKDFLSRWSKRKLEADEAKDAAPAGDKAALPVETRRGDSAPPPVPEFDLTKLPSLESIGANSDIRIFLQRGVPASLTRAALRRAWSADPAIRDFVGLSENSWDFNAPDSIPGFGSLDAGEVKRLAAQLFGESAEDAAGHSSQNRHPLVQSASDAGESESVRAHEMRTAALEESETANAGRAQGGQMPDNKDNGADVITPAKQPARDGASQYKKDDDPNNSLPAYRRHGGALPE
jgi:hypothetical protein